MTTQAGIDQDRTLACMTITAIIGIWFVKYIPDKCRSVAAMGAVTGTAVNRFHGEIGMLLPYRCRRMTTQTKLFWVLDQEIGIG